MSPIFALWFFLTLSLSLFSFLYLRGSDILGFFSASWDPVSGGGGDFGVWGTREEVGDREGGWVGGKMRVVGGGEDGSGRIWS